MDVKDENVTALQKNAVLEDESSSLRVEKDVLLKRINRLEAQRTEDERLAKRASLAQEEVLHILGQKEQAALLQTAGQKETRKALNETEVHCRQFEVELSSVHAHGFLHLQNESDSLKAALDPTISGVAGFEARQLPALGDDNLNDAISNRNARRSAQ
ncbi:hypothetical protein PsorP6_005741 [Peronosclerospora sorghi]|uniref:Uncharacterized protein n=1 Tax=Peronosclerospora sorghi TaxID=230839 RepID=A0ACC0W336_9STRA|nr:hypothetical protein PsorP6_005741 [Peronosclerospora sorghi]